MATLLSITSDPLHDCLVWGLVRDLTMFVAMSLWECTHSRTIPTTSSLWSQRYGRESLGHMWWLR